MCGLCSGQTIPAPEAISFTQADNPKIRYDANLEVCADSVPARLGGDGSIEIGPQMTLEDSATFQTLFDMRQMIESSCILKEAANPSATKYSTD